MGGSQASELDHDAKPSGDKMSFGGTDERQRSFSGVYQKRAKR
jgi:hypothetical protein